ncbi:MAG: hypothetical protein ACPHVU_06300, partial [Flavobacteriaceae bacterium]
QIIILLQKVLDISKTLDSNNELSLTTDLQEEIEIFIRKHKYLPGVQSRAMIEAEQSWNVSENVRTNLEKI